MSSRKKPKMSTATTPSSSSAAASPNTGFSSETGPSTNKSSDNIVEEYDILKDYILQCPHVSSSKNNVVMQRVIEAVEKEKQRHIRDLKLKHKFGNNNVNNVEQTTATSALNDSDGDVVVVDNVMIGSSKQEKTNRRTVQGSPQDNNLDDSMMEWQDVQEQKEKYDEIDRGDKTQDGQMSLERHFNHESSRSYFGKQLAKTSIDAIAEHGVAVSTPIAAIAVALHAALRSDLLGFACTGIPDESQSKSLGFAPPIRELPKTQFLPLDWEGKNPNNSISLRYRKNGTGATVLKVTASVTNIGIRSNTVDPQSLVQITLGPANSKEPSSHIMTFPLSEHINLDSWNAAIKASAATKNGSATSTKSIRIPPSLHYKQLAGMMSNFCQTFDLGAVMDPSDIPYMDNTVVYNDNSHTNNKATVRHNTPTVQSFPTESGRIAPEVAWKEGRTPATLDQAFPDARRLVPQGGDFGDDLLPAGLQDPRFLRGPGGGRMGGNLMGPNHPLFCPAGGVGGEGPMPGGPGSMQPRFDPFYPPGVDDGTSSNNRRGRQKPSRTGEPNPDHLPPPNSFGGGDNMFS